MDFEFTQEQNVIRDTYRKFCRNEVTPEYVRWLDENVDFVPDDLLQKLADLGTMGITLPEEYGGLGLGMTEMCIVMEELCTASTAVGMCASIPLIFGGKPIKDLGTHEQKSRFLPGIASGKYKWALALSEPGGGTDILGAIKTSAVRTGDEYVINGSKMWTSGAHVADYLTTLVITDKEVERKRGCSILIVDARSPGITIKPIRKLGCHAAGTNQVFFEDVRVPAENLLGEENRGWYQLLTTLNGERNTTAMYSLGIAQAAFNYALAYAQERKAFGKTIGSFQILQHYLADVALEIESARNLIYKCAWLCDQGRPYDREVCMAKIVASRASQLATLHGMEIMGGYGYASEYDMQRYFRDYKQMQSAPISDEMAKNYIMQSYGLPRSF